MALEALMVRSLFVYASALYQTDNLVDSGVNA